MQRPDGTSINVGRTHRQFEELLSWVDAGCYPFLIGPAGSFKTSAAAKVAEALGRPFHMDSMSEGKTPFDLLGFNDATGKPVHTELRKAWEHGGVFLCDEMDAGKVIGMGRTKVYEMMAAEELPVVRIGTAVRVPKQRLLLWIERNTRERA